MKKILYQDKSVFIATFIMGLLTHGYAIVNKVTNHDDMSILYGCGSGIANGRWMWVLLDQFKFVNPHFIYGLFNLILMSICAVLLVRAFNINNVYIGMIIGASWVSFPANTSAYFYGATLPIYSVGILLAVFAIYFYAYCKNWKWYLLVLICGVCATGCYQAYYAIVVAGILLHLIQTIYLNNFSVKEILQKSIKALGSIILILGGYLITTKMICFITKVELVSYQGMDKIGSNFFVNLPDYISSAYNCYFNFNSNIDAVFVSRLVDIILPCAFWVIMGVFVVKKILLKQFWAATALFAFALLYPLAVNLVYFYGAEFVYSLMQYCNAFLPVGILVLICDMTPTGETRKKYFKYISGALNVIVVLMIMQNCMLANQEYYSQKRTQDIAMGYLRDVVTRVRALDGYTQETPMALVGYCSDPDILAIDNELKRSQLGGITKAEWFISSIYYNDWLRSGVFAVRIGYTAPILNYQESLEIGEKPEVQQMPNYPADGSVKMVDGVAVVHFSSNQ